MNDDLARSGRANEIAPAALLQRLKDRGFQVFQDPEIEKYLDLRQANAATFLVNDLLLRPDARTVEVLEEYLHNIQRRVGLTETLNIGALENHVKAFMLRHSRLLGISEADASWLTHRVVRGRGS